MKRSTLPTASIIAIVAVLFFTPSCSLTPFLPIGNSINHTHDNPKVTIHYQENAQFELISPQGTRVLIDVFNPSTLTRPVTEKDTLLTTHGDFDHINHDFINSFPGQQLRIREGEINLTDVTIKGIASSHFSYNQEFRPEGGSNYIFIVDMGGLRIAHFGDIGQDQLTKEQLYALSEIDIALTQLVNPFSQMDLKNKKGFKLMEQIKPKLIIPCHGGRNKEAIEYAKELWEVVPADSTIITVGPSDFSDRTKLLIMPESPKVTIHYQENTQFELISPQGTRVLIDVFNPSALTRPVTEKDILLTTHACQDHIDHNFANSFPGQQLRTREGEINLPDVTIRGIASSHNAHDELRSVDGSNYIFVVDMVKLRIAHFGDIGQDQLTKEQLETLGEVDIALTPLINPSSQMDLKNKKGFKLMEQIKPKLIIPTHGGRNKDAIEYAMEQWDVFHSGTSVITVGRSDLFDWPRLLLMGNTASSFKKTYNLPEW